MNKITQVESLEIIFSVSLAEPSQLIKAAATKLPGFFEACLYIKFITSNMFALPFDSINRNKLLNASLYWGSILNCSTIVFYLAFFRFPVLQSAFSRLLYASLNLRSI